MYQTEFFQNKTAWAQTKSENEMHVYWYITEINNQSWTSMLLMRDVGKTKVKIEIVPVGGDIASHLARLPPHD